MPERLMAARIVHEMQGGVSTYLFRPTGSVVARTNPNNEAAGRRRQFSLQMSAADYCWEEVTGTNLKAFLPKLKLTHKLANRMMRASGTTFTHFCDCGAVCRDESSKDVKLQCVKCDRPESLIPIGKKHTLAMLSHGTKHLYKIGLLSQLMDLVEQKLLRIHVSTRFVGFGWPVVHFRAPNTHFFNARANMTVLQNVMGDRLPFEVCDGLYVLALSNINPDFFRFTEEHGQYIYDNTPRAECIAPDIANNLRRDYIYSAFHSSDMAATIAGSLFGDNSGMDIVREAIEPLYFSIVRTLDSKISIASTGDVEFPAVDTQALRTLAYPTLIKMGWGDEQLALMTGE